MMSAIYLDSCIMIYPTNGLLQALALPGLE
jgi:hypothetical protein